MVASLLLALAALRAGLALRRSRRGLAPRDPSLRRRHLRFSKPAVWMVLAGFVGGPVSMAWLRGEPPFGTAHAWIGLTAATFFASAAVLGRRLERGRGRGFDAHAALGVLALLAAAVAAVAGFVLLP
jgi:polyferredoxin